MNADAGNFTSPNYPSYYQGIIYCEFDIKVEYNELLILEFEELNIGHYANLPYGIQACNYGYIFISSLSNLKKSIKLCNNIPIYPIKIYGQSLRINFRSFNETSPFRFRIKYTKSKGNVTTVINN